ncbi:hypothetical protein HDU97_000291 [Phlyctochytrium planicorne]|nr:hypothetical protein HDU97_000291 [Phlyctochytrium planicorne]
MMLQASTEFLKTQPSQTAASDDTLPTASPTASNPSLSTQQRKLPPGAVSILGGVPVFQALSKSNPTLNAVEEIKGTQATIHEKPSGKSTSSSAQDLTAGGGDAKPPPLRTFKKPPAARNVAASGDDAKAGKEAPAASSAASNNVAASTNASPLKSSTSPSNPSPIASSPSKQAASSSQPPPLPQKPKSSTASDPPPKPDPQKPHEKSLSQSTTKPAPTAIHEKSASTPSPTKSAEKIGKLQLQPSPNDVGAGDAVTKSIGNVASPGAAVAAAGGLPGAGSKFCHECGNKHLPTAKFCSECGVKRI